MKNYQNQLERFRDIAKQLVDQHSADLFNNCRIVTNESPTLINDAYHNHLDILGRQLGEQAERFVTTKSGDENLKSDIWNVCKKYLDQFVKRNEPE